MNDDRRWVFSAGRLGGTLAPEALPGTGKVSTIYFPEREAVFVRLLFSGLPDEVTELTLMGPGPSGARP